MSSIITGLIWDDWNEQHIARHHVTIEEVEDVCVGEYWMLRAKGRDKRAVYG